MDISIELVFLFACALFVLHFIINECRCGYTNVEGFECGSCPWSTAKCPPECTHTSTEKCGVWGMGSGARYECACPPSYAGGKPVCLDTGSTINLDIGILDLSVEPTVQVLGSRWRKAYMYQQQNPGGPWKWVEYTWIVEQQDGFNWADGGRSERKKKTKIIVTDNKKLELLSKLFAAPYYIQNIAITTVSIQGWELGVKTWNIDKGKHFYFSDRTGEVYCLSVTSLDTADIFDVDFPHTVGGKDKDPNQVKAYIQNLGYKESDIPFC